MVRIYQAPTVNQTPLNQRNTRWNEIKSLSKPHPETDSRKFGYWFNYFWDEAREVDDLTAGDQARLCDAFFTVFDKSPTGAPTVKPTFARLDALKQQNVLRTLLTIGFMRVNLDGFVPTPRTGLGGSRRSLSISQAVDCPTLQAEVLDRQGRVERTSNELKQRVDSQFLGTITLGFRGDGRSYEDLVTAGGFLARARSGGQQVMKDYGFDQPWHPFGLHVYANSLFLRKGHNKDNCLHTVVSIGTEFNELVAYPLLTDPDHFPLCLKPLKSWDQNDVAQAAAHRWKVRAVSERGTLDHLEHELRIYVVRLDHTRGFSTQGWQRKVGVPNPFPEIATDEVPLRNILAEILLTRRYYHDGSSFELYDVEFRSTRLLPSREVIGWRFGDKFPATLEGRLSGLERSAKAYRSDARARYQKLKSAAAQPAPVDKSPCPKCGKLFPTGQLKSHMVFCRG